MSDLGEVEERIVAEGVTHQRLDRNSEWGTEPCEVSVAVGFVQVECVIERRVDVRPGGLVPHERQAS